MTPFPKRDQLRHELASLKFGKLYKRALSEGVPEDDADDANDRVALIEQIMAVRAGRRAATDNAGSSTRDAEPADLTGILAHLGLSTLAGLLDSVDFDLKEIAKASDEDWQLLEIPATDASRLKQAARRCLRRTQSQINGA